MTELVLTNYAEQKGLSTRFHKSNRLGRWEDGNAVFWHVMATLKQTKHISQKNITTAVHFPELILR